MSRARDRGSGTVLAVGLIAVLLMLGSAATLLLVARAARHQAETAADLAALAAATDLVSLGADPCAEAARVARNNGAIITSCTISGDLVSVIVQRPVRVGGVDLGTASARARAGPVDVLVESSSGSDR